MKPFCLTIAGSDPSSGAGIQADIRAFDRCGVHPFSVITALTFQTANSFKGYVSLSKYLDKQLKVLFDTYPIKVVKVGMIPDRESLEIIKRYIIEYKLKVVLDPVSIASAGGRLSTEGIEDEIERKLLPIVSLVTPNFREALLYANLEGESIKNLDAVKKLGSILLDKLVLPDIKYEKAVVIKSVMIPNFSEIYDLAILQGSKKNEKSYRFFKKKKEDLTSNVHGTGCIFSSSIAAFLAKDYSLLEAIEKAEMFFDEKFQRILDFPSSGLAIDLTYPEEKIRVINQIKQIYNFISNDKKFSNLIPEVRMNISGSLPSAKSKEEVAGIEGRITIINEYPKAMGEIKFGVSDHTARLILTAKEFDNSINYVMNLKYKKMWVEKLVQSNKFTLQEIRRDEQPKSMAQREYSTMQWLIQNSVKNTGKMADIIWDEGSVGKEPMIRLFSKDANEMIEKLSSIKQILFS
jgi:hydroxymethylpyrimidine kinase / phosphomethylpyrimidine kinase / thiamine-phosphate diphosphorylase